MRRYFWGIDWADRVHDVCVSDEVGESVEGLAEFGRRLDERGAEGI